MIDITTPTGSPEPTPTGNPVLEAAQEYARMGWQVLRVHGVTADHTCTCGKADCCSIGKHPKTQRGSKDADVAPGKIMQWFGGDTEANIGIATGSMSKFFVLDVDAKDGGLQSLASLEEKHGKLPSTPKALTGSGGFHYFFRLPDGPVPNSQSKVGDGIDVRGEGGYVVAAPSKHRTGGSYSWIDDPFDTPLAEAPLWLLELVVKSGRTPESQAQQDAHPKSTPTANLATITTECAWMRSCRDNAAQLGEEAWFASLNILAGCVNGREIAHEWSAPYPKYSKFETDKKFDHAANAPSPRTCANIRNELNGEVHCGDCPHWGKVKSPIQLGMPNRPAVVVAKLVERVTTGGESPAVIFDHLHLRAIAQLDAGEYGQFKSKLKSSGVDINLNDLDRAVRACRNKLAGVRPVVRYVTKPEGTFWNSPGGEVQLANFTAVIDKEIVLDDGAETTRKFQLKAQMRGSEQSVELPAEEFQQMGWPIKLLGKDAIVYPEHRADQHVRAAIQEASKDTSKKLVFTHTGWRKIDGEWVFLHGGGAIGATGNDSAVAVHLPPGMQHYELPDPPQACQLRTALDSVLKLLDLGSEDVMVPLVALVFRALLGPVDFAVILVGQTGSFKSELAALVQQFFGASFNSRCLPANWSSTANAIEALAFLAKDTCLVIDDFAPGGGTRELGAIQKTAERVFRNVGNQAGRGRMGKEGGLRAEKPPRALILATGEDVPQGHSVRARMLILEQNKPDVDVRYLSQCQAEASEGRYAMVMAAFVQWLARDYGSIVKRLKGEVAELRGSLGGFAHGRTATLAADLLIGLKYFLDFAQQVAGMDARTAEQLRKDWQEVVVRVAHRQSQHQAAADPVARFFQLLRSAISSVESTSGQYGRKSTQCRRGLGLALHRQWAASTRCPDRLAGR